MSQEMVYESKTKQTSTVIGAIILFKDISEFHEQEDRERERLQVAYEKADLESRAKTEFMNRMSHDIRTPINGIQGCVNIADRYPDDLELQQEAGTRIRTASSYLLNLVNDVLDMNKLESGNIQLERKHFNLLELLHNTNEITRMQANEAGVNYYVEDAVQRLRAFRPRVCRL